MLWKACLLEPIGSPELIKSPEPVKSREPIFSSYLQTVNLTSIYVELMKSAIDQCYRLVKLGALPYNKANHREANGRSRQEY